MNTLLAFRRPPHPEDEGALAPMASIGIGPRVPFDAAALSDEQRDALRSGIAEVQNKMAAGALNRSPSVDGWQDLTGFGNRAYFKGDYLLKAAAFGTIANTQGRSAAPVSANQVLPRLL